MPTWVAVLAGVASGGFGALVTAAAKFRRTPAEQDAKELSMLTAMLQENRALRIENGELRSQFEKIWEELAGCQKQHRECEGRQDKADRRAERQQEQIDRLTGEIETLKRAA